MTPQELAFHPGGLHREDRQSRLDAASKLYNERERYAAAMHAAAKQIDEWRAELLEYMDENKLDLIVIMAGVRGMDGPTVGAPTLLPVVRAAGAVMWGKS